jgi:hypothetical protein
VAVRHLLEIDANTGRVLAEWKNDATRGLPVAPEGRTMLDVTAYHRELGDLVARGATVVNGELVIPDAPAATLDLRSFLRLFSRTEVVSIGARRESDPEVAYFWTMLTLGTTVDLAHPDTAAGLDLLIAKSLLTPARKAAILARQPPP